MKTIVTLFAAVLAMSAFAQDEDRMFGKSDAQILAMGQDKWMDFYEQKAGGSNLDMIQACHVYEHVAARRNDRLISRLPAHPASDLRKLRKLLDDFSGQSNMIGSFVSGGGSMWTVIDAGDAASREDVLYQALGGKGKGAPATRTSKVGREIERAQREIRAHRSNDQYGNLKEPEALKAQAAAAADYRAIVAIASHLSRSRSDAVLAFCYNSIHLAANGG